MNPSSVVYIVLIGKNAKIGFSTKLKERLSSFETATSESIELLVSFPGGRPEERRLHALLSDIRLPRGEFFRFDQRIDTFASLVARGDMVRAWAWLDDMKPENCKQRRLEEQQRRTAARITRKVTLNRHYAKLAADRKLRLGW